MGTFQISRKAGAIEAAGIGSKSSFAVEQGLVRIVVSSSSGKPAVTLCLTPADARMWGAKLLLFADSIDGLTVEEARALATTCPKCKGEGLVDEAVEGSLFGVRVRCPDRCNFGVRA